MYDYEMARQYMESIGLSANRWNSTVIVAAALERGIDISRHRTAPRLYLQHGGKRHFWQSGRTRLNSPLARRCARLKDVSSRLLRSRGINALENSVFSSLESHRAWAWACTILPVVIKPVDGNRGRDVYVNVTDEQEFKSIFRKLASLHEVLLVEQFAEGDDYRATVVDGSLVAATKRTPAHVVGDGATNILDLVTRKNQDRGVLHKKLMLDQTSIDYLYKQGFTTESIPDRGHIAFLRGNANHATGGDVIDATDSLQEDEVLEIENVVSAIPGLRLVGVDVLLSRHEAGNRLSVIELNTSPNISPHHFPLHGQPRDAAGAVLDAMFPAST